MLAVTGVFGMASYSVSRRMREHGIRVALGAKPNQVISSILAKPVLLLLSGSVVGVIAAAFSLADS
jgi:ABC-type antimicrobial peptide transport system permease subunit